jgi:hypothetical protein
MGYGRKNKKIDARLRLCAKRLKRLLSPLRGKRPREAAFDPDIKNMLALIPIFSKQSRLAPDGPARLSFPRERNP